MNRTKPPKTKLIDAAQREQIDEVRLLLEAGADPNARDGRKSNETALHESCYHNNADMTRLLLDHGADPNVHNDWGNTPLHHVICLCGDNPQVVALLMDYGADPNTPMHTLDKRNGLFPLHVVCQDRSPKVARLLLEHGADAYVRDKDGCTPIDIVIQLPPENPAREEILDLFRQYAPDLVMEAYCNTGVNNPGGMSP